MLTEIRRQNKSALNETKSMAWICVGRIYIASLLPFCVLNEISNADKSWQWMQLYKWQLRFCQCVWYSFTINECIERGHNWITGAFWNRISLRQNQAILSVFHTKLLSLIIEHWTFLAQIIQIALFQMIIDSC